MGITTALLTAGINRFDAPPFVTASITPTANKLLLLTVITSATTAATPFYGPSSISGNGLTWTLVGKQDYFPDTAGSPTANLHSQVAVYRAMGASPTAGAITFTYSGATPDAVGWSVVQFDGMDTTGTNGANAIVQVVTKQSAPTWPATNLSITLAALGNAANATFGSFGAPWDSTSSPLTLAAGTGYTNLSSGGGDWLYWLTEVKLAGSTTVDTTPSTSAESIGGVAIEIKAASTSTPVSVTVTGASSTGTTGSADEHGKANVPATSSPATATAGTVAIAAKANVAVTGAAATATPGSATTAAKAGISAAGAAATGTAGTVAIAAKASTAITGAAATATPGAATTAAKAGVVAASASSVATPGTVSASADAGAIVSVTGAAATATVGDVAIGTDCSIEAASATTTMQAGVADGVLSYPVSVQVDGAQCSAETGGVTTSKTGGETITVFGASCAALVSTTFRTNVSTWGTIAPLQAPVWVPIAGGGASGWIPVVADSDISAWRKVDNS